MQALPEDLASSLQRGMTGNLLEASIDHAIDAGDDRGVHRIGRTGVDLEEPQVGQAEARDQTDELRLPLARVMGLSLRPIDRAHQSCSRTYTACASSW